MAKKAVPDLETAIIIYGSGSALTASGKAAEYSRRAGICVTGFYEADFYSTNYSDIVDRVLEQAAEGMCVWTSNSYFFASQ